MEQGSDSQIPILTVGARIRKRKMILRKRKQDMEQKVKKKGNEKRENERETSRKLTKNA